MAITDRLRPLDLKAFINANGDMLLSAAITLMQGAGDSPKTFVCPKCADLGVITLTNPPGMEVPCDVCFGYAKTDIECIPDPDNPGKYLAFQDITGPDTVAVDATITLANSLPAGVWSSSNGERATVGADTGVVTGHIAGAVTITYTFNAKTKTKDITVT